MIKTAHQEIQNPNPKSKQQGPAVCRVQHPQTNLLLQVQIGKKKFLIDPDGGSDVNLCDSKTFSEINADNNLKLRPVRQGDKPLLAVNNTQIKVKGRFTAQVSSPSTTITETFYVIEDPLDSPPLLSENCLLNLGLMRYCPEGSFATKSIKNKNLAEAERLKAEFPSVFTSKLGCFKDFAVSLTLEKDAKPHICRARAIPLHLEGPTRSTLESMIKMGIIRSTAWHYTNQSLKSTTAQCGKKF